MQEDSQAARGDLETAEAKSPETFGYCCECGTWDAHGATCVTCGVDFRSHAERDASS